ncbi:uncharacterized protein CEXT_704971 [Caerostris extrusa]|uniref:Uncharacterized protein n=1 Tax=Caerostris extrusa TaxID=172846 RepID=A0AAV4X5R3_CAEEX|nr:uncharacterized protein CEXT_704971 [Caerostris extrusa]
MAQSTLRMTKTSGTDVMGPNERCVKALDVFALRRQVEWTVVQLESEMCSLPSILPVCAVLVSGLCFILQFVVLPSDEWGHFSSRRIRGVKEERGHFGLWRVCSTKNRGAEECVAPRRAPSFPPTRAAAGVFSIFHLLLIACFLGLSAVRILQIVQRAPDLYLGTKRLCIAKVGVALTCVVISISVSILASVGEGTFKHLNVFKGWAFWIQIVIISVDIVLLLVCAFENIQYWQVRMVEPPPPDPTDLFPETFIVPDYEADTPSPERVVYVRDAGVQSRLDDEISSYDGRPEKSTMKTAETSCMLLVALIQREMQSIICNI